MQYILVNGRTKNKVDVDLRAVPLRHPAGFSSSSGNKRVRNGVGGGGGSGGGMGNSSSSGGGGGGGGGGGEEELVRLTKEAMAKCGCKRCITREMNNPTKSLNSVSKIDRY